MLASDTAAAPFALAVLSRTLPSISTLEPNADTFGEVVIDVSLSPKPKQ